MYKYYTKIACHYQIINTITINNTYRKKGKHVKNKVNKKNKLKNHVICMFNKVQTE